MTEGSFDDVLLAQVFIDGFRLCRRFHDYQSLWHKEIFTLRQQCRSIKICSLPRERYHTLTKFLPGSCLTSPSISSSKSAAISSEGEVSSSFSSRSSKCTEASTCRASSAFRATASSCCPAPLKKDAWAPCEN